MGLSIGIEVKKQHEGYMSYGSNPKGSREQIEAEVYGHILQKFPEPNGFSLSVSAGEKYGFRVSFSHYADTFMARGYEMNTLYLTIIEYILEKFSDVDGIEMYVYSSP